MYFRIADKIRTNSFRFRQELFDKIHVLGQVDRKFIAVVGKSVNTSTSSNNNSITNILVLFDQHAVHERIRLENLICGKLILNYIAFGRKVRILR